ncbi:type II toxin-antitoxin system RelE/ParE family toxin [Enterovirga rhinocerotis]|uniref:Toxin ParE1/3/4 n=1 Tax=Enterovirga rhinocerotis TaxID=1339210 RepID=A0A4R7CA88_9HYPH|nr:type II toxin-antitoxin system RelE/ParE family toxin [Enterovirga rhinocerotis]TDR94982.1 toxin ParE1/3/4 [Enterovirga rhinocerotis]
MATIVRAARVDEDLIEIWHSIAADSPVNADRIVDEIERRWLQLEAHPLSGPSREDIGPGIRHLLSAPYLILYRAEGDSIRILRVLHGRRNLGPSSLQA